MSYFNLFIILIFPYYTKKLKNISLEKTLFVTCEEDACFSNLNKNEIGFIIKNNGKILKTDWDKIKSFQKKFFPNQVSEFLAHRSVF